jgi:uncharacterized membrane protein
MGEVIKRIRHFAWQLHDQWRAVLSLFLGAGWGLIVWLLLDWSGKIAFLAGWILALGIYLILLGIVIFQADGAMTKERVSRDDPNRIFLMIILIVVALLGNLSVGVVLTSVGNEHPNHARVLVAMGVMAVVLSWFLLHTAIGQYYARLYYEDTDSHGRPFPEGMRRGFSFPGSPEPTYLDFLYVSFTIGLTYALSDVNVTNEVQRRLVLLHSVISFFFYSTILGVVMNAIVTS